MDTRIAVRRAGPEDTGALVDFNLAMALETEGKRLDRATLENGVCAVLANPGLGFYLVAEADGSPVGGLLVTTEWSDWRNADFWWIQSVYVRPTHRRNGVYRLLHTHVRELARKSGVCGIRLYVDRENQVAKSVYGKLGMRMARYDFYEEGFDNQL